jgi:hypothetical protein
MAKSMEEVRGQRIHYLLLKFTPWCTAKKFGFINSQKMNWAASVPISTFMCLWAIYISSHSVHLFSCKHNRQTNQGNICINRSQKHECRNWYYIAAQFHFWEYLFRIFGIVPFQCVFSGILSSSTLHPCDYVYADSMWRRGKGGRDVELCWRP